MRNILLCIVLATLCGCTAARNIESAARSNDYDALSVYAKNNSDYINQLSSVEWLSRLQDKQKVIDVLLSVKEVNPLVSVEKIKGLSCCLNQNKALNAVIKYLSHYDGVVRESAFQALSQTTLLSKEQKTPFYRKAIYDKDPYIVIRATKLLRLNGHYDGGKRLYIMLGSISPIVDKKILEELQYHNNIKYSQKIIEIYHGGQKKEKILAERILVNMGLLDSRAIKLKQDLSQELHSLNTKIIQLKSRENFQRRKLERLGKELSARQVNTHKEIKNRKSDELMSSNNIDVVEIAKDCISLKVAKEACANVNSFLRMGCVALAERQFNCPNFKELLLKNLLD